MAKVYKCTFNNVNGENTGIWARIRPSGLAPSVGILFKKNCPDGLTFLCDPNDGSKANMMYRLLDPKDYGIVTTSKVYVWLNEGHLTSWKLVDDPRQQVNASLPTRIMNNIQSVIPKSVSQTVDDALTKNNDGNITNSKGNTLNDDITKYISYIGKNPYALTPRGDFNEYSPNRVSDNYFMDYSSVIKDINTIEKNLNIGISAENADIIRHDMMNKFNRFLIAFPDLALAKTFSHVFFTRPDLNLYDNNGILLSKVANDPFFYYLDKNNPELLKSLTSKDFSVKHDFNPFLSNKAGSFELKDEFIDTSEYGETFTGWKIKYGKHNIKSKTAGEFSINYTDDSNYNILKIHKAWVDYISKVYRGEFDADIQNIKDRTIDYACSVYYFLCGPDGETILFWSKYTGVFPTIIPSSASSWQKGNLVKLPEFSISYEYSWKEDLMPTSLAEFNINSRESAKTYAKIYEPAIASTGKTFVNAPFVESVVDSSGKYEYKLRFRP